jgi:type II secretory pathway component PulJ
LTGPELLPPAVADRAGVAAASEDRLERLQRRVEQLERRVQELEKAATETRKKP